MKSEFRGFGLPKYDALRPVLEILGVVAWLPGLKFSVLLLFSSGGLALLMIQFI